MILWMLRYTMSRIKRGEFNVDAALDSMDINFSKYIPSQEALEFFALMRVFKGHDFEIPNPKFHYFIVDMLFGLVKQEDFPYSDEINKNIYINPSRVGVLASRGTAKSTITTAFYPIYCAIRGETPLIKNISHILILSDSQQGGARDQARLLAGEFNKSEFAQDYFESMRFTESEAELVRKGTAPLEKRHILIKLKGAQTGGIRSGSRNPVTGDRYAIILADDVIKNEAEAHSTTIMHNVETALMSDALNAMRGRNTQLVLINTPFTKNDIIYKSLESGTFTPLVAPICKEIREGMSEEEFQPLWEEMHSHQSVMERYLNAVGTGTTRAFNQELMLRISSEEDRLITDEMLDNMWFSKKSMPSHMDGYNLVVTTDFTASNELRGDFSGVAVWAVNSNRDWFLVDLVLKRMTIDEQDDRLLQLVQMWTHKTGKHLSVGIEVDGQQRLNVHKLKEKQIAKNVWFTFANQIGDKPDGIGISRKRAGGDKHAQFMRVHSWFQAGKVYFAEELKGSPDMQEMLNELKYINYSNIASKNDDALDLISMATLLNVTYPSVEDGMKTPSEQAWVTPDGDIWWTEDLTKDKYGEDYGGSTVF
jgi:phage terminase large subunit-like protein